MEEKLINLVKNEFEKDFGIFTENDNTELHLVGRLCSRAFGDYDSGVNEYLNEYTKMMDRVVSGKEPMSHEEKYMRIILSFMFFAIVADMIGVLLTKLVQIFSGVDDDDDDGYYGGGSSGSHYHHYYSGSSYSSRSYSSNSSSSSSSSSSSGWSGGGFGGGGSTGSW